MSSIENGGNMMYSAADLDDDGWPDLVFLTREAASICWGGQDGYTLERRTDLDIPDAISSRVADLNSDGYLKCTTLWVDHRTYSLNPAGEPPISYII